MYYSQGKDDRTKQTLFLYTSIYSKGSIVRLRKKGERGHVFVPDMVGFHLCAGENKATAELAISRLRDQSKSSPHLEMVTAMEEREDGEEDGSCMEKLHGVVTRVCMRAQGGLAEEAWVFPKKVTEPPPRSIYRMMIG